MILSTTSYKLEIVIQCIDFINPLQVLQFCRIWLSPGTFNRRRVERNNFLDHRDPHPPTQRKKLKHVNHDMLQIRHKVIQYIDFVMCP